MAYSLIDFTTYIEVDEDGHITVTSSKIGFETRTPNKELYRTKITYVYKDYGAGYFSDFDFLVSFKVVLEDSGEFAVSAISNTAGTEAAMIAALDGMAVRIATASRLLYLYDYSNTNYDGMNFALDTEYFLRITRVGTTLTCYVYSDAARTALIDTLSIVCSNIAMRYHMGLSNRQIADMGWCTGYIQDPYVYAYVAPTVTTQVATDYTKNSCLGHGTITDTGGINATRRGFCYMEGLTGDPNTTNGVAYDDGDFGAEAYTKAITGLKPSFNYRIRAYATNPKGTSYGTTIQMLAAPHAMCR